MDQDSHLNSARFNSSELARGSMQIRIEDKNVKDNSDSFQRLGVGYRSSRTRPGQRDGRLNILEYDESSKS